MTGPSRAASRLWRWRAAAALVIVAMGIGVTLLAAAAYATMIDDIDAQWRQATAAAAARSGIWLVGAAQTLLVAAQIDHQPANGAGGCGDAVGQALANDKSYAAVRLEFSDGGACDDSASELAATLARAAGELAARPHLSVSPSVSLAAATIEQSGRSYIALQAIGSVRPVKATALIAVDAAARAIALDAALGGGGVALMSSAGKILATEPAGLPDPEWAPKDALPLGAGYSIRSAGAGFGGAFSYATQPIAGSDFFVIERFSNAPRRSAQLRFLALALAPPLLAALCFALGGAMQGELLQGIDAIKSAMLAKSPDQAPELAPEDAEMPLKLREFAAAYNAMARQSASHEESLHASLMENQFLLRELNHRVKSSLQIIQSYLSLTRRLDRRSGHHTSAAAIEARVQVLSTAYRKAFSEGRMRDVRIRQFAEEIVLFLSQMFEQPGLTIELKANVAAALVIDRAIPLGLAMVESLIAGMSAEGAHFVVLQIDEVEDLRVEMRVWTDGVLRPDAPNAKLMGGLALQLAANVEASGSGTIMHWRFQGRPPPILLSGGEPPLLA